MATNKMMLVNFKAYADHLLASTTSHHSPLDPMLIIKNSRYCLNNKRQIINCSSLKLPRFVIANARASKEVMLLSTAEQSVPYSDDHQSFDPRGSDPWVVAENILKHVAHMVETDLLECLEKLEEKLSEANDFSPLLSTIKKVFTNNMANTLAIIFQDKVVVLSKPLLLAEKTSVALNLRKMQIIELCNKQIENMQAVYWEEFPESLKKMGKTFRELTFDEDNLRPSLTDGSMNKLMEDPNALPMIQLWGQNVVAFFHPRYVKPQIPRSHPQKRMFPDFGVGPDATCNYTFYYGSNNKEWIGEFVQKATVVANDSSIKATNISIELCCVLDPKRKEEVRHLSKIVCRGKEDQHFLRHFESRSDGRFVLTYNQSKVVLHDGGRTILKVLEEFHQWKNMVPLIGFENSFITHYHGKFPRYDQPY